MKQIASFSIDHTKLLPGMYLSRQDGPVSTWDIRMKRPNAGDYLSTGCLHALEHLLATYLRNSPQSANVVYVGPMGCRTGFYVLTQGLSPTQALSLVTEGFRLCAAHWGLIPGATEAECGNYRDMDPQAAVREAAAMYEVLTEWSPARMQYEK